MLRYELQRIETLRRSRSSEEMKAIIRIVAGDFVTKAIGSGSITSLRICLLIK